jgi:hypothetical protein
LDVQYTPRLKNLNDKSGPILYEALQTIPPGLQVALDKVQGHERVCPNYTIGARLERGLVIWLAIEGSLCRPTSSRYYYRSDFLGEEYSLMSHTAKQKMCLAIKHFSKQSCCHFNKFGGFVMFKINTKHV